MPMTMRLMIGELLYIGLSVNTYLAYNKIMVETLTLLFLLNVFRKVACEELSLECNFTMGRPSSNNIDIASTDLSPENLGHKNSMSTEKDQTTCHRHTASSVRGCSRRG